MNFEVESAPDGRVVSATLATARKTLTLTGAQFRDALGLRSSWFQLELGASARGGGRRARGHDAAVARAVARTV